MTGAMFGGVLGGLWIFGWPFLLSYTIDIEWAHAHPGLVFLLLVGGWFAPLILAFVTMLLAWRFAPREWFA